MSGSNVSYEGASNQVETSIEIQLTNRDRKTVFFRGLLVFPAVVYIASFTQSFEVGASFGGLLFAPALLALLVRGVYPSYVLTFNHAVTELGTRLASYLFILNDEYPSIEDSNVVQITYPEVDGGKSLSRGLPLIKWLFAIPLYIVGVVYSIYGFIMLIVAWFSILFTGTMPESSADAIARVTQYWNRIYGYAVILVTDEYPSFSL